MPNGPTAAVRERADVLDKFVLTKPPLALLPEMEEELNRRFEARFIDIQTRTDPSRFDAAAEKAAAIVRTTRPFRPHSAEFDRVACTDRSLTPLMLMLCLRRNHRDATLATAESLLIDHDDRYFEIRTAVLELFGYGGDSKKADAVALPPNGNATAST